jgi:hypothetical protein
MVLFLTAALVLFSFGSVMGQDQGVYLHHVDGLNGDVIEEGAVVTFYLGFANYEVEPIVMISNGFEVAANPEVTWTSTTTEANPAYAWDFTYYMAGAPLPVFFGNFYPNRYFSCDGMGADTCAVGALCSEIFLGLPAGFNDYAYAITIGPVSGNGIMTLDNVEWYPPSNDWSWGIMTGSAEVDCNWDGPHSWIVGDPGEPPVIEEIADFTVTVGDEFYYDAEASGFPDPVFSLDGEPTGMVIDPATGEITYTTDVVDVFTITVIATNAGGTDTEEFTLTVEGLPDPITYHEPSIIHLKDLPSDRCVYIWIENEENALVDLSTVRVHGKIPPYTEAYPQIVDGKIVTQCFVFRFFSAYRPIPETVNSTYTVNYTKDGLPVELTGTTTIEVPAADVTLDGYVNDDDAKFMGEYLWNDGQVSELDEMMDVNRDGRVNPADLLAILRAIE